MGHQKFRGHIVHIGLQQRGKITEQETESS